VNIKITAKKTTGPSFVTSSGLESLSGKFRYRNPKNILILIQFYSKKEIYKSDPDPKKSQVSCRISNPDPVHAHLCYLSEMRGL